MTFVRFLPLSLAPGDRSLLARVATSCVSGENAQLARAPAPSAHRVAARGARAAGGAGSRMTHFFLRADDATVAADVASRRGAVPGHLYSVTLRASLAMRACDEFCNCFL